MPLRLVAAIERALEKDPGAPLRARWTQFAWELRQCLAELGAGRRRADVHPAEPRAAREPAASRARDAAPALAALSRSSWLRRGRGDRRRRPRARRLERRKAARRGCDGRVRAARRASARYDPDGGDGEHDADAPKATDDDLATYWNTEHYNTFSKRGVGVVLDAGRRVKLASVTVVERDARASPRRSRRAARRTARSSPTRARRRSTARRRSRSTAQTARYYVVWITTLGPNASVESTKSARAASTRACERRSRRSSASSISRSTQLGVRDPRRLEELRVHARRGEAGHRVQLVDDDLAVALAHEEVDACEPFALGGDERVDRALLHELDRLPAAGRAGSRAACRRRRTSTRSRTTRARACRSCRAARRSAAARGCRARRTRPRRRRTNSSTSTFSSCRRASATAGAELGLVVHLRDADRRAEPRGLHEHRVAERVLDRSRRAGSRGARATGMPLSRITFLKRSLSIASAEAATPAPTYGDVRELEQPLHRPVLAERPVQDRQHDVDRAERRERPRRGRNGQRLRRTVIP